MKISKGDQYSYRWDNGKEIKVKLGTVVSSTPHVVVLEFQDGSELHCPREHFIENMIPRITPILDI